MYDGKTVGVVVPAYNEEGHVGEVIGTMPAFVDRIYQIDDGSTDDTWREIRAHAARVNQSRGTRHPAVGGLRRGGSRPGPTTGRGEVIGRGRRVVPLRHGENRGVGAAIKTGYRRAREDGIDVIAVMAGDGQMDPAYLEAIVAPVAAGRADYAKGNRLVSWAHCREMSAFRLVGNILLTVLTKASSGYWRMRDPQNGYTAISRGALDAIDLDAVFDDYGFANAMLVHLNIAGMRLADVPVPARYGDEDSHIDYRSFVPKVSAVLARGLARRLTRQYLPRDGPPRPVLYGVGLAGVIGGLSWRLWGRKPDDAVGASTATLLGAAVVLTIVAERYASADRRRKEAPNRKTPGTAARE
jgi:glycosyltransferase involved in cell wall biosynthesis